MQTTYFHRKWIPVVLIAIVTIIQTGCLGTSYSRCSQAADSFGKWPYQAVVTDCDATKYVVKGDLGMFAGLYGIVSLPMDFLCDTVLLPLDLFLWPFGFRKSENIHISF